MEVAGKERKEWRRKKGRKERQMPKILLAYFQENARNYFKIHNAKHVPIPSSFGEAEKTPTKAGLKQVVPMEGAHMVN